MTNKDSSITLAIDLVSHEYKTRNPLIIYEKIQEDLKMEISIHQIMDYLEINNEDYEKESNKIKYYSVTNN